MISDSLLIKKNSITRPVDINKNPIIDLTKPKE